MKDNTKDVYTYASQALDMLEREKDINPNYKEIKQLLIRRLGCNRYPNRYRSFTRSLSTRWAEISSRIHKWTSWPFAAIILAMTLPKLPAPSTAIVCPP